MQLCVKDLNALIENIALKENAQFYLKDTSGYYSYNHIKNIFNEAASERSGQYMLNVQKYSFDGEDDLEFSLCVFKIIQSPSFIIDPVHGWVEHKIGYLLLLDVEDYVVVFKKNVTSSELLLEKLKEVDYKILGTIFFDDNTVVEKISMNNTSVLTDAMARKVYEANNLQNSMSTYGLGKYMANSLRVNNSSEKTSVTFNTSRISNYGDKQGIYYLASWAKGVVDKIRNFIERDTFIDIFAEPIDYETVYKTLIPISILISASKLLDDYESGAISGLSYTKDGHTTSISANRVSKAINKVFSIRTDNTDPDNLRFAIDPGSSDEAQVILNRKSITLRSDLASRITIEFSNNTTSTLTKYLNSNNDYIINFENLELVYYQRKLFKDRGILNAVQDFLDVFIPKAELAATDSEKGEFDNDATEFTEGSIFNYIDRFIVPDCQYAFLDDLGDEWADFITITGNKLTFIHAKHKNAIMSATAFQDVVAQAMKNIGNFKPAKERVSITKKAIFNTPYRIDNATTQINKLRRGDNLDNGIAAYTKLLSDPNFKREVILVVNFISKSDLTECLVKLEDGEAFGERNQVIQLLWLISGLVNCCMENGISIYIHCKP